VIAMSKQNRIIVAIIVLALILGFMGYIVYLRVMYEAEIEVGLGLLATAMGYMIRWIHEGNGEKHGSKNNETSV
jgi:hypothetical protein